MRKNTFVGNTRYDHRFASGLVRILVDWLPSANTLVGNTVGEIRAGVARTHNYGIRATASTTGNVFTGSVSSNSKTLNLDILGTNSDLGNNEGTRRGSALGTGRTW